MDSQDHIPKLSIGYYDPFESYQGVLKQNISDKTTFLTNLHWRKQDGDNNEPLRSITQLELQFIEELPKQFDHNKSPSLSDAARNSITIPLIRVMFVKCKSMDEYRAQVRPLIEIWLKENIICSKAAIEWFIIFEFNSEMKLQNKIYEKLQTDFNFGQNNQKPSNNIASLTEFTTISSDRIIKINDEELIWNRLNMKLKIGILQAFNKRIKNFETFLIKEENPLKILILKESIAHLYLRLRLFEDALNDYDKLERFLIVNEESIMKQLSNNGKINPLIDFINSDSFVYPTVFQLRAYIISKQFIILEGLAIKSISSISLQSVHIRELLKRFSIFITIMPSLFPDEKNNLEIFQWGYESINFIMAIYPCKIIIKSILKEDEPNKINEISENFGELLLLKRSILLKINQIKSKKNYIELLTDLQTDYQSITQSALKFLHHSTTRERTVDYLSIDLAMLDYQNGRYKEALSVLETCPKFYQNEGWFDIGREILEIVIDCEERIGEEIDTLAIYYLEYLSFSNNDKILQKLLDLKVSSNVSFNINKFFKIECDPNLIISSGDCFELQINLINENLNVELPLKDIKLYLYDGNKEMIFTLDKFIIGKGFNFFKLKTNSIFLEQKFIIGKFIAKLNNILLIYQFNNENFINFPPLNPQMSTSFQINKSTNLSTMKKSISIFIETFDSISNLYLEFMEESMKNIQFLPKEINIISESSLLLLFNVNSNNSISINSTIPQSKKIEIQIPYDIVNSSKTSIINLSSMIKYKINGIEKFQNIVFNNFNTNLPISVSVQDIFKKNSIFAKFTINSVDEPIIIKDVKLNGNEKKFQVSEPGPINEIVSMKDQLCLYFFQIRRINDEIYYNDEYLKLNVTFRELKDELLFFLMEKLSFNLQTNGLQKYLKYLNLKEIKFNYEKYVISRTIEIIGSNVVHKLMDKYCRIIPIKERLKLLNCLENLVSNSFKVSKSDQDFFKNEKKNFNHLEIDVQLPSINIIHEVQLSITSTKYVQIGIPLKAKLSISSYISKTQQRPSIKKSKRRVLFQDESFDDENSGNNQSYLVECLNVQDSWIINGLNKFMIEIPNISSSSSSVINHPSIELSLIPLKLGKLILPKIKITTLSNIKKKNDDFQIVYKEENEFIYVLKSTTTC